MLVSTFHFSETRVILNILGTCTCIYTYINLIEIYLGLLTLCITCRMVFKVRNFCYFLVSKPNMAKIVVPVGGCHRQSTLYIKGSNTHLDTKC